MAAHDLVVSGKLPQGSLPVSWALPLPPPPQYPLETDSTSSVKSRALKELFVCLF